MVKIFTIVTGETWNAHRTYVEHVSARARLTEVQGLDESDVILVFCPVASRHGPDIDAALKEIPANKPAVLVVMNHTCHPDRPVYDSSDYVSQSNVLSVDCVFHESSGLFRCAANEEAVEKTLQHIKKYSEETSGTMDSRERKKTTSYGYACGFLGQPVEGLNCCSKNIPEFQRLPGTKVDEGRIVIGLGRMLWDAGEKQEAPGYFTFCVLTVAVAVSAVAVYIYYLGKKNLVTTPEL